MIVVVLELPEDPPEGLGLPQLGSVEGSQGLPEASVPVQLGSEAGSQGVEAGATVGDAPPLDDPGALGVPPE